MEGIRALYKTDPKQYNRQYLARKFGISFEAVSRILKSNWREKEKRVKDAIPARMEAIEEKSITDTKWSFASTSKPTPAQVLASLRKQ